MSKAKSAVKQRVLQMAEDQAVAVEEAPPPRKQPRTKPLAVRLPYDLVELLHQVKEEKDIDMTTLLRPVLERAFRNTNTPSTSEHELGETESEEQLYVRTTNRWFNCFVPVTAEQPAKPGEKVYKRLPDCGHPFYPFIEYECLGTWEE